LDRKGNAVKPETELLLRAALDYIWTSCQRDAEDKIRPMQERVWHFGRYIGWLEGNILKHFNEEQALEMLENIQINRSDDDAVDEAALHDDQDGSFY
jgi:hypothetical protein